VKPSIRNDGRLSTEGVEKVALDLTGGGTLPCCANAPLARCKREQKTGIEPSVGAIRESPLPGGAHLLGVFRYPCQRARVLYPGRREASPRDSRFDDRFTLLYNVALTEWPCHEKEYQALGRPDKLEISSRRVGWGLRDMALAGLMTMALLGAGAVALAVGSLLWPGIDALALSPAILVPAIFACESLLVIPAWVWGPRKYGGGWAALGLHTCPAGKSVALFFLGFSIILLVNAGWDALRRQLGWAGQPDYLPVFGGGVHGLLIALLLGGAVAPAAEEIFFRGYLFAGLRERWGTGAAVVLSSLLFSLAHATPGVLPPIFVMGAVFCVLYEQTDSLWPCIALHGAMNTLAFVTAYLIERFPHLVPGIT